MLLAQAGTGFEQALCNRILLGISLASGGGDGNTLGERGRAEQSICYHSPPALLQEKK